MLVSTAVSKLGRVLDPEELDHTAGPRGRFVLEVPAEWLAAGDAIEIIAPGRVACARCAGGGCDNCERSGAVRLPPEESARTLQLTLPLADAGAERSVVRLVRPFGAEAGVEQLWVELRIAPEPSPFCRRSPNAEASPPSSRGALLVAVALALALALMMAAVLGLR